MTQPFGSEGAHFKWTLLLVLCNRVVTASFAALALVVSTSASGRACSLPNQPEPSTSMQQSLQLPGMLAGTATVSLSSCACLQVFGSVAQQCCGHILSV